MTSILQEQKLRIVSHIDFKHFYDEDKLHRQDHVWINPLLKDIFKDIINQIDTKNYLNLDLDTTSLPFMSYTLSSDVYNIESFLKMHQAFNSVIPEITEFVLYIKKSNLEKKEVLDYSDIYKIFKEKKHINSNINEHLSVTENHKKRI